jgi:hypothetical protein
MTTDERIENLEKGLASARRFNRWLLAAVGLALGVWILAGTFGPTVAAAPGGGAAVKEVRANRFVVEDENGKTRALLAALKDGPTLNLYDENGKPCANLYAVKDGPGLALSDANGMLRVALGANKEESGLILFDEKSKTRATLGVTADGPGLTLWDENGKSMPMNSSFWQAPNPTAAGPGTAGAPGGGQMPVGPGGGQMPGGTWVGPGAGKYEAIPEGQPVPPGARRVSAESDKGPPVYFVPAGPDLATQIRKAETELKLAQVKAALAATQAQVGAVVNEVCAKRFVLVDDAGKVCAVLGVSAEGPNLFLVDVKGKVIWHAP